MKLTRRRLSQLKTALRSLPNARASVDADSDSLVMLIDLESFISKVGPGYLTDHQSTILRLVVFEGYTEKEVGAQLGVSQQAVHYALSAALTKIANFLSNPRARVGRPIFTKSEVLRLKQLYSEGMSYKEIAISLGKKLKSIQNKIRYLQERGELDVRK